MTDRVVNPEPVESGTPDDEEFVERWFREDPPADEPSRPQLRLVNESIIIVLLYVAYSYVRNSQGSNKQATAQAFTNARRVIRLEQWMQIYHEQAIQRWFIPPRGPRWFVQALNGYYGIAHFLVTIAAMVWCFKRLPWRYRSIRNGLALMTLMALIGFKFFPLMPPRLLPEYFTKITSRTLPGSYRFVDTLEIFGGPWHFKNGPVAQVSNQFAAMPSLHFGWAAWCAVAFWPWARTWPRKIVLFMYPSLTLFAIVVTANHYFLDALGGVVVFTIGMRLGSWLDRKDFHVLRRKSHLP
jgi:PAP2 superfamily